MAGQDSFDTAYYSDISMDGQDSMEEKSGVKRNRKHKTRKLRSVFDMTLRCDDTKYFCTDDEAAAAAHAAAHAAASVQTKVTAPIIDQQLLVETMRYEAAQGNILAKSKNKKKRSVSTQTPRVVVKRQRVNSRGPLKYKVSKRAGIDRTRLV